MQVINWVKYFKERERNQKKKKIKGKFSFKKWSVYINSTLNVKKVSVNFLTLNSSKGGIEYDKKISKIYNKP